MMEDSDAASPRFAYYSAPDGQPSTTTNRNGAKPAAAVARTEVGLLSGG